MNSKMNATELTTIREKILINLLNGDFILEDDIAKYFPCSVESFISINKQIHDLEPSLIKCKNAGGLNNHKDVILCLENGSEKGSELKVSKTEIELKKLIWQPWQGAVQFLQGQIKSKRMASFLCECSDPLFAAWYEKVKALMAIHTPTLIVPTLEDYKNVVFTIGAEKGDSPAAKLIQLLRANKTIRSKFHKKWLEMEDEWFPTHKPNDEEFLKVLTEILEEKDYWIAINKAGAFVIEGFIVKGLRYLGVAKKPKGGSLFQYSLALQKKSGGEIREIPIQLKMYWKNGGQGSQNINILVVSG